MTHPDVGTAWDFLAKASDEDIPLVWAALVIARDEYPDLDIDGYVARVADLGERLKVHTGTEQDAVHQVRALNRVLFDELGFQGNQQDYYDPRNSYLNEVVDRRLGIPISLAVLQIDMAQRIGLAMRGVSFPGHFLVSLPVDGGLLVLDPYHRGRSIDAAELKQRAKPHMGDTDIKDEQLSQLLAPATNRAILARMLRNLKALYAEREDWDRALRCTDRLIALEPSTGSELRDRGLLYLRVGHVGAAREDLQRYLAANPRADDLEQVREVLITSSTDRTSVN